jgi:hypothetical protein
MADEEKKDETMSAFNSAFSYFDLLNVLEKGMIQSKLDKDFKALNEFLDLYWIMISEWFDDKEEVLHNDLRVKQKEAHKFVLDAINHNKAGISTEVLEVYIKRWRALLKTYHQHGMRMPKRDDEGETGILSKKARMRY